MGRPAKAVSVATGARSKEDIALREEIERTLRGDGGEPSCPGWLTPEQAGIFEMIVHHLAAAELLATMDSISLANFCVAVDRLQYIEMLVNDDPDLLMDRDLMNARRGYESTMWRGCSEFCLSPQARAKIGSIAVGRRRDEEDPLAAALR